MCSTELRPEFGYQVSDHGRVVQRSVTGLDWAAPSSPAPSCTPRPPPSTGLLVDAGWRWEAGSHPVPAEHLGVITTAPLLSDSHGPWRGPWWGVLHHSPGTSQGSWQERPMALPACPHSQWREHSSGASQGIWPLFSVQCRW